MNNRQSRQSLLAQFFAAFAKIDVVTREGGEKRGENAFGQIARRRFNKYGRGRTGQGEAAKNFPGNMTRQQIRARLRAESLAEINARYGLEPRRLRRILGLALARNRYRASTVGVRVKGAAA